MKNLPHLLCIDDDNKIRELLEIYLSSNNFRVSVAKDSFEAEKLTNFFLFDLVILDIMMPNKDGIQFLNHFRTLDFNTPVLMLTADNQIEKKKASYAKGCDDYLVKPFEPSELVLRIRKLLNPRFNKNISSKKVYFGDFEYDLKLKVLSKNNISVSLTSTETLIIEYLTQKLNKEISREEISNLLGDGICLLYTSPSPRDQVVSRMPSSA